MDHPYQTTMQLPAAYAVITEEEMTYLEGGSEIVLGQAFGHQLTLDTDVLAAYCVNFAANLGYYMLSASYSYITNLFQSGLNNGLSLVGTVYHTWGKLQTPWSKVAALGITGMAGTYAAMQAITIYQNVKSLIDSIVNPMPDFSGATPQTAAA